MYDIVIKNGTVVTNRGVVDTDVAITGQSIAAVGMNMEGARVIDATDCLVIPGSVDPHVHLQMPLGGIVTADTFETGTVAAVCGGTTTIIDFVTPAPGQTLLSALKQRRKEADGSVAADYGLHMTIPTWHASDEYRLADIPQAVEAGCATFKMYQAYDGMALSDVMLLRAMSAVAEANGGVVLHSEVGPVIEILRRDRLREGQTRAIWHARTRPIQLEASAVHRAIALAELAGVRLYVFHIGASEVVDMLRQARYQGIEVYAETCPQYLLLSADTHLTADNGELYICAPPLRSEADHAVLWKALQDGAINVVSTDHCPWTRAQKHQPNFASVPGGIPSIEAKLALIFHFGVVHGALSKERWVDTCCTAPAHLMGLTNKGRISPGCDADIVIYDPSLKKSISVDTLHEAADWTPYEGMTLDGWPRTVMLRGEVVVEDTEFLGDLRGQFVPRRLS